MAAALGGLQKPSLGQGDSPRLGDYKKSNKRQDFVGTWLWMGDTPSTSMRLVRCIYGCDWN